MRPCSSPFALRTMSALLLKVLDSVVALFAAPGGYSVLTPGRLEVFCHRLSPTAGGGRHHESTEVWGECVLFGWAGCPWRP